MALAPSVQGPTATFEAAAQLAAGIGAQITSTGIVEAWAVDSVTMIGIVMSSGDASPFPTVVALPGSIIEVTSDGSGAIDEGNHLAPTAVGTVKVRAVADGATARQLVGVALTPASNVAGLRVRCLVTLAHYVGA